jgi:hypothetical protein
MVEKEKLIENEMVGKGGKDKILKMRWLRKVRK